MNPRYSVAADALPHVARVTCGRHCLTCAGAGEWVVVVPTAMVDLDWRIRAPAAFVAAARQLHGGPPVLGYSVSRRGGLHVYLDAPASDCVELATEWRGDPSFASFSVERGWCGERPARSLPVAVEGARRRPDWWRELHMAHRFARALVAGEQH